MDRTAAEMDPDARLVTIVVNGQFDRRAGEVAEIVDIALHEAGLCGCGGPGSGYTLSVREATFDSEGKG